MRAGEAARYYLPIGGEALRVIRRPRWWQEESEATAVRSQLRTRRSHVSELQQRSPEKHQHQNQCWDSSLDITAHYKEWEQLQ